MGMNDDAWVDDQQARADDQVFGRAVNAAIASGRAFRVAYERIGDTASGLVEVAGEDGAFPIGENDDDETDEA